MTRVLGVIVLVAMAGSGCGVVTPSNEDLRSHPHGHLVWAARTGDVAAIRRLAATGIDLDASPTTPAVFVFPDLDHKGWTALQHAAQKGQIDSVRTLLELGARPDARPQGSAITPLIIAAGREDLTIARLLLDAGADMNLSRSGLAAAKPGGPLWQWFEDAVQTVGRRQPPQDGLARLLASTPPGR